MAQAALQGLLSQQVTIEPWQGQDDYRNPAFGEAVAYPARVELRSRLIAGSGGQEISARGRVFLGTVVCPSVKDRLTLPAGYSPPQPPILEAYPVADERGRVHHCVVYFG